MLDCKRAKCHGECPEILQLRLKGAKCEDEHLKDFFVASLS